MFLMALFLKAGFLTGRAGFAMELLFADVSFDFRIPFAAVEVPLTGVFLVKKLWMDR